METTRDVGEVEEGAHNIAIELMKQSAVEDLDGRDRAVVTTPRDGGIWRAEVELG